MYTLDKKWAVKNCRWAKSTGTTSRDKKLDASRDKKQDIKNSL